MTYDEENDMIAENVGNKIIIRVREQEIANLKDEIETLQILTSNTEAAYKIRELKYEVKTLKTKLEELEEIEEDEWLRMIALYALGTVFGIVVAGSIF